MKYKAYKSKTEENDIIVECTECETKHHFNFYTFGRYFLDNVPHVKVGPAIEDDLFQVDGGIMSPIWVCRNWKCTNEARVNLNSITNTDNTDHFDNDNNDNNDNNENNNDGLELV